MTQTTDRPRHDEVHEVDLAITGMTCASCSARIEKKLGRLDGVDAVVNLATEKATVRYAEPVTVEDLLSTVRATGYGAEVVAGRRAAVRERPAGRAGARGPRGGRPRGPRPPRRPPRPPGRARGGAQAPRSRRRRAHRAGRRARDGARHPPRLQPVGAARARDPGRALGRLAVPPRRRDERPPRRLDDGHPGVDRRAHRLPVVGRRRAHRSGGRDGAWRGRMPATPPTSGSRPRPSSRRSCSSGAGSRPAPPTAPATPCGG